MKLILIDQPIRNRGDESAHKALVRRLASEPFVEKITVPYRYPQEAMRPFMVLDRKVVYVHTPEDIAYYRSRIYGVKKGWTFLWKLDPSIRRLMALYREADVVVSSPGGINLGGFKDWHHMFFLELARYLGKPLAYFGRSIGPFSDSDPDSSLFHEKAESILDYMSFISLRDSESEKYVGNRSHVMTFDSAFLDSPESEIPMEVNKYLGDSPYIVFVPNSLVWHYRYKGIGIDRVRSFFTRMLSEIKEQYPEHKVILLPQLYDGPTWIENDRLFFEEIASEDDFVASDAYSSDIQQAIIRGASFLVGARYHSVVFAINNDTPFVALSYEHKMSGLAISLGKGDRVVDISSAFASEKEEETAIESVTSLLRTLEKDPQALSEAQKGAEKGYKAFVDSLKGKSPLVSVVVPNYNHAPYLEERIESILQQSYKNIDLIVLDDCSTDDSMSIIRRYEPCCRIVVNEKNSGSPFKQWMKGIEIAKGSLVWIAESDDSADPSFLERTVSRLESSGSALIFTRSMEVDSCGREMGIQRYQKEMDRDFDMDGKKFINKYLARKNVIANASAAVFRKDAAISADREFMEFSGAGDILFWSSIAENGRVSFIADPLNRFRQHGTNRTAEDAISGKGLYEALKVSTRLFSRGYISRFRMLRLRSDNLYRIKYAASFQSEEERRKAIREWSKGPMVEFLVWLKKIKRRKAL